MKNIHKILLLKILLFITAAEPQLMLTAPPGMAGSSPNLTGMPGVSVVSGVPGVPGVPGVTPGMYAGGTIGGTFGGTYPYQGF